MNNTPHIIKKRLAWLFQQRLSDEIEGLLSLSTEIHAEADSPENMARFQGEAEQQQKGAGTRKGLTAQIEELKAEWLENRLVEEGIETRPFARGGTIPTPT